MVPSVEYSTVCFRKGHYHTSIRISEIGSTLFLCVKSAASEPGSDNPYFEMKRIVLLVGLVLFAVSGAYAGQGGPSTVKETEGLGYAGTAPQTLEEALNLLFFGADKRFVRADIGMSWITGIDAPTGRLSFKAGLGLSWKQTEMLRVEENFGIAIKGYSYKENLGNLMGTDLARKDVATAWWLEENIMVRYGNKWSIAAGPYIGIGCGGSIKTTAGTADNPTVSKRDYFGNNARSFDWGLVYDVRHEIGRYLIGIEVMTGLYNIQKGSDVKNSGVWLYVGYRF